MPPTVFIVLIYFRAKYLRMLLAQQERNYKTEGVYPGGKGFEKYWERREEWSTRKSNSEIEWWTVLLYEYLLTLSLRSGYKAIFKQTKDAPVTKMCSCHRACLRLPKK